MPSRSKMFSLPKLRSRSRSVARNTNNNTKGQKIKLGGGDTIITDGKLASTSATAERKAEPQIIHAAPQAQAQAATPIKRTAAAAAAAVINVVSPENHSQKYSPPSQDIHPTQQQQQQHHVKFEMDYDYSNNQGLTPISPARSNQSVGTNTSSHNDSSNTFDTTDDSAAHFTSAFVRSPPSFDQFDSALIGDDGGVFPQQQQNQATTAVVMGSFQQAIGTTTGGSGSGSGSGSSNHAVHHSHSNSHPQESVRYSYSETEYSTSSSAAHYPISNGNGQGRVVESWGDCSLVGGMEEQDDTPAAAAAAASHKDETGTMSIADASMAYSQDQSSSISADPPAILLLEEEELLVMDNDHHCHHRHPNDREEVRRQSKKTGNYGNGESSSPSSWAFDDSTNKSFTNAANTTWGIMDQQDEQLPKNKNRRMVSPSPLSPANTKPKQMTAFDEDFAAWGTVAATTATSSSSGQNAENVFGSNFFTTGFDNATKNETSKKNNTAGFKNNNDDDDDGFGTVDDDAFFGDSWHTVAVNTVSATTSSSSNPRRGGSSTRKSDENNDPWGEMTSFADSSFINQSSSNEHRLSSLQGGNIPLEEKKDDDHVDEDFTPGGFGKKMMEDATFAAQASQIVWNDQVGRGKTGSHPLKQQPQPLPLPQQQAHPLKTQQEASHEVLVSFDNNLARPPTISTERRVSQGSNAISISSSRQQQQHTSSAAAAPQQCSHRRKNSNGSQNSKRSQLSKQSQQQRHTTHNPNRGNKKSGGSVGSNSSAVDQILEHYRQKRLAKNNNGGGSSSVQGSAHSSGRAGSGSVVSGLTQFSAAPTGAVGNTAVHRNGSNGSAGPIANMPTASTVAGHAASGGVKNNHRRVPSGGSQRSGAPPVPGHRRIPSSGSASTARSRSHRRNPSNESVSRIIEHLETSAAASAPSIASNARASIAAKQQQHRASPSPSLGKYYPPNHRQAVASGNIDDDGADGFLMANIEHTLGPRGVAPDMESLTGRQQPRRSSAQASRSRPNRSPTRNNRNRMRSDASVDSRTSRASRGSALSRASRNSFRTYQSTRSALTSMSKETQSVANDLFRLEAQLAEQVSRQQSDEQVAKKGGPAAVVVKGQVPNITYSTSGEQSAADGANNTSTLGAAAAPRPTIFQVTAPKGKLGIILSNKKSRNSQGQRHISGPTHVSAVRSESVLAGKVHVGDVFVSIDGEDVSNLNSKEITIIMARKSESERLLTFRSFVTTNY